MSLCCSLESQQVGLVDAGRSMCSEGTGRKEECRVIGAVGVEVGGELRERDGMERGMTGMVMVWDSVTSTDAAGLGEEANFGRLAH